ncbi:7889_t:CDS:10 [Funneliformis geosporum]|nr:7889_t:CDS:10 [Funneliformis geosporum]
MWFNSLYLILILTFFIIFCSAQYDTTLTYYEDPSKELYFFDSFTDTDGSLLIQLARYNNPDQTCIDPDIHLRVVYANGTVKPLEDEATTLHTGMIIDFDGNLLQYFTMGVGIGDIHRSKNKETGFTWSRKVNATTIAWSRFIADSGDGGNCLVIVTKLNKFYASDPSWEVNAFFIDKSAVEISLPYLLYQSQLNLHGIEFVHCRNSNGEGYKCLMNIQTLITAAKQAEVSTNKVYYLITFLTSGSVISNKRIDSFEISKKREVLAVSVLFNGGFLLVYEPMQDSVKSGVFLTQSGDYEGDWKGLPGEVLQFGYLEHNDTMWGMLFQQSPESWTIMTDKLRVIEFNYKHRNPSILETTPTDDVIRSKDEQITIKYDKPIILSSGNISIYQVIDNMNELLRQSYSGLSNAVSVENDTVFIKVLSSTFNSLNSTYFIQINDDFVSSQRYGEAISGINKRVWFLNTSIEEPTTICQSSVTVLVKLNAKGTEYFKTLKIKDFDAFYNDLMNELSEIIPVDRTRLPDTGRFQSDPVDSNNLILLQVKISQPNESTRPCAKDIVSDLGALITNKHSTLVARYPLSSMLDENYGIVITAEGLNSALKFGLIFILCGFLFVSCLYGLARYINKKARNMFVFTGAFILTDFVLDILFIVHNSQMTSSLLIPSIVFLVVPTAFNIFLALYIVFKEHKETCSEWFKSNRFLVAIITVLSSADVELLNIITSNICNLNCLSAPLSENDKFFIFLGSFANIFLEDVPQFIIRVIYLQQNSIIYDPIPVISLISAGVSILFSLIGRGYDTFSFEKSKRRSVEMNRVDHDYSNNMNNNGANNDVEERIDESIEDPNDTCDDDTISEG